MMNEINKKIEIKLPDIDQQRDNLIIKRIDLPDDVIQFRYFPLQKLLTCQSQWGDHIFDIINGEAHINKNLCERLGGNEHTKLNGLSFRESIISTLKNYDQDSILNDQDQQIQKASFNFQDILSRFEFLNFNFHLNQIIFRSSDDILVIISLKRARILRSIYNNLFVRYIELYKQMMLFNCLNFTLKLYFNIKNKTKLVRRFQASTICSFNGRYVCVKNDGYALLDICNMKAIFVIQKHNTGKPVFINQLGLLVVWHSQQLDIFDFNSLKMIRSIYLPKQGRTAMAYDGSGQPLIFYKINNKSVQDWEKVGNQDREK